MLVDFLFYSSKKVCEKKSSLESYFNWLYGLRLQKSLENINSGQHKFAAEPLC